MTPLAVNRITTARWLTRFVAWQTGVANRETRRTLVQSSQILF